MTEVAEVRGPTVPRPNTDRGCLTVCVCRLPSASRPQPRPHPPLAPTSIIMSTDTLSASAPHEFGFDDNASTTSPSVLCPSPHAAAATNKVPEDKVPEVMKVPTQVVGPKPTEEQLDTLYEVISRGRITVGDLIRHLAACCTSSTESHTEAFQEAWKEWGTTLFWIVNNQWENGSATLQARVPKEDRNVENVYVVHPWC